MLGYAGINPDRLLLAWVSGSEANRFAEVVQEFTEWVRKLGPLETKQESRKSGNQGIRELGGLEAENREAAEQRAG